MKRVREVYYGDIGGREFRFEILQTGSSEFHVYTWCEELMEVRVPRMTNWFFGLLPGSLWVFGRWWHPQLLERYSGGLCELREDQTFKGVEEARDAIEALLKLKQGDTPDPDQVLPLTMIRKE